MNRRVQINGKTIGEDSPCFIIAEAGSNHNGDYSRVEKLIDVAVYSGADAVKFQNFKAQKLYLKNAGRSGYLKSNKSIYEIIQDMEMPEEWIPEIYDYCKNKGIIFLSSPFDERSADLLQDYINAYKIASYEITDLPLIRYISKKGKPIILSTGASDMDDVRKAVEAIAETGNENLVLMQCTASYPAPLDSMNLKSILTLKKEFCLPVGLSDHSREYDISPMAAVAIGADCIEKHFTLSNMDEGPDHKFALEPDELEMLVRKIRKVEKVMGTGEKLTLGVEKELHKFARRSIFAVRKIRKGEKYSIENIAILRCGNLTGELAPDEYYSVIDRSATRDIDENSPIKKGDYE